MLDHKFVLQGQINKIMEYLSEYRRVNYYLGVAVNNDNIQIKMLNQEQLKRKFGNNTKHKNSNSTNSLLTMKDIKKVVVSREKQIPQNIIYRQKNKNRQTYEQATNNPTAFNNIRNVKEHSIQPQYNPKKPKQVLSKTTKIIPNQDPQIQAYSNKPNVLVPKSHSPVNISQPKTQRSLSRKQLKSTHTIDQNDKKIRQEVKRPIKISGLNTFDADLQCTQVIKFKKNNAQIPRDKTMEKGTDRKNMLNQVATVKPKEKVIPPRQVIAKFEKEINEINSTFDYQSLLYLDSRQKQYRVEANYIQKNQKNFTWLMRALLVQWVMHVSYEYSLKRQTFHITVCIVDSFLSNPKQSNLSKSDFQLVGAASMFIASKLEQFEPKSSEQFVKTVDGSYTAKQIKNMEKRICKTLRFHLNPPTLYRWANRLMVQWDNYLTQNPYAQRHQLFATVEGIYFKNCEQSSYTNYRKLMQYLDCALLDIQTVEYNQHLLVCAFMYILIGKEIQFFTQSQILNEFPYSSHYLFDKQNLFNDLFSNFLETTFNFLLLDLLPEIQYCATYINLSIVNSQPILVNQQSASQTMQLEQYCSFQTFNKHMYKTIKKRKRGIIA